jgi:tRNA nucleotidyltransferase (CCA-adding enzyme)
VARDGGPAQPACNETTANAANGRAPAFVFFAVVLHVPRAVCRALQLVRSVRFSVASFLYVIPLPPYPPLPDMAMSMVNSIATAVRDAGGRGLVVGGWVRDRILGLPEPEKSNVDLEVFGVPGDRLRTLLETFGRVEAVGESFQVYKVGDIDVSLPRRDSKAGRGHRGFVVTGDPDMSIAEAARRRDFTVNAISWDPLTEEYFDPFDGRGDLARRLLRVVDPHTFGDDSLRVLRGVQFAARFALDIEPSTAALCREIPLDDLPPERVWGEFSALRAGRRSGSFSRWIRSSPAVP